MTAWIAALMWPISRLRKKLCGSATEPFRIKTIRNKGYLFAPQA